MQMTPQFKVGATASLPGLGLVLGCTGIIAASEGLQKVLYDFLGNSEGFVPLAIPGLMFLTVMLLGAVLFSLVAAGQLKRLKLGFSSHLSLMAGNMVSWLIGLGVVLAVGLWVFSTPVPLWVHLLVLGVLSGAVYVSCCGSLLRISCNWSVGLSAAILSGTVMALSALSLVIGFATSFAMFFTF